MIPILSDDEKRAMIRRTWKLEGVDEVPFLIEVGGFHAATSRYFSDDAAELDWNEEFHRSREGVYDYGIPNLKPNLGINIVACGFGCGYTVNDEADPWVKPLLREENAQDVYTLELPDLETNPYYRKAWDRIEYFGTHSALPMRLVNVPSPLVTASLIWDYTSFIEATLIFPDEVHALLERVTEATIAYVQKQLRLIGEPFTMGHEMWYLPGDMGVRVSDDTAALLSPNLYREFGVRYNNMISRAFGGIVVHSCGDLRNVLPVMMETDGLVGIDLTIPQNSDWKVIRDHAVGRTALNLRHYFWDHDRNAGVKLAEYSAELIDYFGRRGIFIQTSTETQEEAKILGERLHRLLS